MPPYLLTQRVGAHPKLAAAGSSDPYFAGRSILGRMRPIHVDVPGDWAPCLAHVSEWPFAEDAAGVPFDVANIWALRTRSLGHADGGEADHYTAVPRILPPEYTAVGRCGRVPLIYDHLGEDPMQGVVEFDGMTFVTRPVRWRTATGQYPTDLTDDDGYLWVPMNLNQQTIHFGQSTDEDTGGPDFTGGFSEAGDSGTGVAFGGPDCSVPSTIGPTLTRNFAYLSAGRHVGFRGGKIRVGFFSGSSYPCGIFTVGDIRIVIGYSDSAPDGTALPGTILFDASYTFQDLIDIGPADPWLTRYQIEVSLPAMLVPSAGAAPKYWSVWMGGCFAGVGGVILRECHLSPRTDVPPWFWSSTRNRVAPGGIIVPP